MSLRLALFRLASRRIAKPLLARAGSPQLARRLFRHMARFGFAGLGDAAMTRQEGAPPTYWFTPPGAVAGRVLLYFHGGGYILGSPKTHAGLIARLAGAAGMVACAPAYRRAPEHPFPAAQDDAEAAFAALVAAGHPPATIALAGDSAGGGLALSLLARLCAAGTPPRAVVTFSAWTDMTGRSASLAANGEIDPLLPSGRFGDLVPLVLAGHPAEDPRASPLFAAYPGCPPVLMQVDADEILAGDSRALAERLAAEGAPVRLELLSGLPHAGQVLAGRLPEADAAVASAAAFLRAAFTARDGR